jgi:hypothetical protein
MMKEQLLDELVDAFLTDLAHANCSPHIHHAYATDLAQLCAFYHRPVNALTAEVLRYFFRKHLLLATNRYRNAGTITVYKQVSRVRSTSFGIRMRLN